MTSKEATTLAYVLDVIQEGVWDWDINTGVVHRSVGWFRMLGFDSHVIAEDVFSWENLIHPDDYAAAMAHFECYISGQNPHYNHQYRIRKHTGDYLWIQDQGRIVARNADGSPARMIGAHLDIHDYKAAEAMLKTQARMLAEDDHEIDKLVQVRITELLEANQHLRNQVERLKNYAEKDPLTGLFNRRKFQEQVEREIARARRYGHDLSLILLDLDYFKEINDTYGHASGDATLMLLSRILQENIRQTDIAARWGGDEFVVIFPESHAGHARRVADKLRDVLNALADGDANKVTCSIGVTQLHDDDDFDSLFQRLDNSMYQAKQQGRNFVVTV